MKLSEAIRLGAMNSPQIKGGYMDGEGRCALSAACDAAGIGSVEALHGGRRVLDYPKLEETFPLLAKYVCPPGTTSTTDEVQMIIWSLNDYNGWTREQIADWVETIENQQEQEQAPAAELVAVKI